MKKLYSYKSKKFESENEPVCQLCYNNLIFKVGYKYLSIIGCSNDLCETKDTKKKTILYKAFLPIKIYEEYINHLKNLKIRIKKISPVNKEYWMNKGFSEDDAFLKIKEHQIHASSKSKGSTGYTKLFYKEKGLSDEEISKKFKTPSTIEFWLDKGYSHKDAKQKISEFQKNRSNKREYLRSKNPEKYQSNNPNQKLYWIYKGFSEEESIEKVKKRQHTFSLQKCIEKYGEVEGKKLFNERQKKWTKSLFENFEKYGDGRSLQSQWASDIIDRICNELNINRPKKEKWISSKNGDLRFSYDFTFNKKIIEFNGDYWHANPKFYDKDFILKGNITAENRWKIDEEKIKLAESRGYEVLVIWESDFIENSEHIINKCIKFIK